MEEGFLVITKNFFFSIPCQSSRVTHCFLSTLWATNGPTVWTSGTWLQMSFLLIPSCPKPSTSPWTLCFLFPVPGSHRWPNTLTLPLAWQCHSSTDILRNRKHIFKVQVRERKSTHSTEKNQRFSVVRPSFCNSTQTPDHHPKQAESWIEMWWSTSLGDEAETLLLALGHTIDLGLLSSPWAF